MAAAFDLVIRNGTIADGRGGEPFPGDVAIRDGTIAEVGRVDGSGRDEIAAGGALVTPGFVDIHTQYDGQITWDERLLPSSQHGVTTVVMGNCGVGFAPCRPQDRELLMVLMEGIEDIPLPVMTAGLPWTWESFPDYLDFLGTRRSDVDFATQIPHGAVRVYAMGKRAAEREPATAADIAAMARVVQDAVAAGALGFSTSRSMNHRTRAGALAPTVTAAEIELHAIAVALGATGKGVLQMIDDFHLATDEESVEFAMWRRLVEASGRPLSFTMTQSRTAPERYRTLLQLCERANADGLTIRPQVSCRPVGSLYGLELSENPFSRCASYQAIETLPHAERVAAMRAPELRRRLLAEAPAAFADQPARQAGARTLDEMYEFGDPPNYAPHGDERLGVRAERSGTSVWELAYDALLARDGRAMLYSPGGNFAYRNLEPSLEMLQHRDTVLGIGDGGAHVARICDASLPTFLLTYWTRDRSGTRLPVGTAVRMLTHDTARAVGLDDRGTLVPGAKADVNVIDYGRLALHAPEVRHDLPAGGTRLLQRADGYVATVVGGTVTYRDGTSTGALPGKLIRR